MDTKRERGITSGNTEVEQEDMSENVALWRRTSTDKQDTDNQVAVLNDHVVKHGYNVVKTIDLPDVSGGKEHPRHKAAMEEVLSDVQAGLYRKLIIRDASRLDRRSRNKAELFRLLVIDAGGAVEAARNPNYGHDSLLGDIETSKDQREAHAMRETLIANVQDANGTNDANGMFRGRAPIGYMVRCEACGTICRGEVRCTHRGTKRLVPDPDTAPAVVEIFRRIARGDSVPVVVSWLAETHGIKRTAASLAGPPGRTGSAPGIIRNKLYATGHYKLTDHQGRQQTHVSEPLVSPSLWQAANDDLASRPTTNAHPRLAKAPDYSGSLHCGTCHERVYRKLSGNEPRRIAYYVCVPCGNYWRAEVADELTEQMMTADTSPEWEIRWIEGSDHTTEIERTQSELDDLPKRRLSRREEQAERERLWDLLDQLEAMPKIAPRRELTMTGRTMSKAWDSWTWAERVAYLRGGQFQVRLYTGTRLTKNGRTVRDSTNIRAERVWLTQTVDVAAGADIGDGMRATVVMGSSLPVMWLDDASP